MSIKSFTILHKQHYPIGKENEYKSLLTKFTNSYKTKVKSNIVTRVTVSKLPDFYRTDEEDDLDVSLGKIKKELNDSEKLLLKEMKDIGKSVILSISTRLKKVIADIDIPVRLKVDIFSDPRRNLKKLTNAWVSTNTRLIKSIPTELLDNVAIVINSGFRNGYSIKFIKQQLQKKFNIADNRAKLIARDQIAKLASDVLRHEMLQAGFKYYKWSTSNDDRVRVSHKVLNDKICDWTDPTTYKNSFLEKKWRKRSSIGGVELHVGQDFQCRCSGLVVITND